MPKRTDIKSILIIGAGPIVIGQACEFDYSGTQACKALKEEGYRIILVNSNPATIMTDPDLADATYIEPITPEVVAKIIAKERPDALLPTMGGQTALNTALSLKRMGVLDRYNVEMIGADAKAIDKAEDRALFREAMAKIGLETPKSMLANATDVKDEDRKAHKIKREELKAKLSGDDLDKALDKLETEWQLGETDRKQRYMTHAMGLAAQALDHVGLPAIIRPSFTLGGTGGGIAYNRSEFFEIVEGGLDASPTTEVLIEESVLGWKEYEMEVVRDKADNCIIICSIENIDPMGVHTGDSITVAPALTLTDKEYQIMRDASIAVLREIGVETGGSNVQFAVNPENGRLIVIEMNPRVSRSSALASKATGFPIAKVAAKLAVGYTMDELENDITGGATPASFEPSIDYVVTKIPRFAFEKFPGANNVLTTAMKSVGEVMAIGRTFQESLQKALRGLETGLTGLDEIAIPNIEDGDEKGAIRAAIGTPTPDRLRMVAQAMRLGMPLDEIHAACKIDPWFLEQMAEIVATEDRVREHGLPQDAENMRYLKAMGFSDSRLASLIRKDAKDVAKHRAELSVHPIFKRIDTCAAEFSSPTAYMYSTYETPFAGVEACEADVSERKKVVILGGGPNRIGQGIEFDYCCCHAAFALSDAGYEAIMINCNPETVSTDYDTSDRLYFEPLTDEDVIEILRKEQEKGTLHGVIVQFGGQTPLKLANALEKANIPILGTSPDAIDLAEDRDRFQKLLIKLGLNQPKNGIAYSVEQARLIAADLGFPLVVRPSYVLGGRAMQIIHDERMLQKYLLETVPELVTEDIKAKYPNDKTGQINTLLGKNPLLFDTYLTDAIEVDVDCLCDGKDAYVAGIMEHIEEAGIHSGDSACSLPVHTLSDEIVAELERQTIAMAKALNVGGLMNVQYAIKDNVVYVLEVNPRASRTVPFVAKTNGTPIAKVAARIMAGESLEQALAAYGGKPDVKAQRHIAVKEAVFPFARFPGVDTLLGPEMRSTGEVMGLDYDYALAFAKSQLGAGVDLPRDGTVFVSVRDEDKARIVAPVKRLADLGFKVLATGGTQRYLAEQGIEATKVNKVLEGRPHIEDAIRNRQVHIVFNTTDSVSAVSDSKSIRRATLMHKLPYYTTLAGAEAVSEAIAALKAGSLEVRPLQDYFKKA
ncbi:carbamoyl-phosphate synthase large subunit [Pseudochrobactrum algeriensis]|uniref:Carbamoyl phosphate synthase large chain n=1 Tax=Pseudochrobactrum saccharolyticum TaxID=354352 RepID=A0A7W8AMI5_9HYPH|nr:MULTISPECIES: carbamoyl-phosphate synthase large subunit [Pseudochrobactrum]MBX8784240.1 carbamoyl-phosphate synthase large subunit [Ochrobactrum sp. GRS2]MBX8811619.1 carbamoyl-phosphate synthase large subunit [Ochrobactrum sp. MR34]KAB0537650.1 carbamoyl-phosphate synthase large subunit [Pseudochrobactrum saccharolyticum]MBB5091975.1 carbamoyl-phosphate synthase large subunit [Pseudochrobactrum saccharolyticum]MDP8250187.1 carbamoyl-phosphate synthase large subunit [Pseudochrobactrum sacc